MTDIIQNLIARSADPDLGTDEYARFLKAYSDATGRRFQCKGEPSFARIFGNSRALAERLIRNPSWADQFLQYPRSNARKPRERIASELKSGIASSAEGSDDAFMRHIRLFKYREMIRIASRDLAGKEQVGLLLNEWSDVADAIIGACYDRAHAALCAKHGRPVTVSADGAAIECTGSVIALGKLGGAELNMSSDIDIILIYRSDEMPAEGIDPQRMSSHEFYVKLASHFTKLLATVTADGFAFRVDHELRPEGAQGPLANSLDAAERYYQYFGRDWERQALIRARPVAGDPALGNSFIAAVRPFVYRRSIAISDLSQMREMKKRMEKSAVRGEQAYDVKHGPGGIREVEFLSQAIQQLFGGARESIRKQNTLEAIDALARESLIHPYGAKVLTEAYSFLRRTENMLQIADDLQVHMLPGDEAGLDGLARRVGFSGDAPSKEFLSVLAAHTSEVKRLFDAIFEADYERLELIGAIRDNAARASNEEEKIESLAWFKNQELRRIAHLDVARRMPVENVLRRLTLAAEAVLTCAYDMTKRHQLERFGQPKLDSGEASSFAIIGMGSLGSSEIDYGSDLDLCFLFSGDGHTAGKRRISNVEYFTKLAQRIISVISLPGRYGRAYFVDSDLRPSGRSGTLVATLESFRAYHSREAHIWERQALLKARLIAGDEDFADEVRSTLNELAYRAAPPEAGAVRDEIVRLRDRSIAERISGREDSINLKLARGGIADIEAVAQMHQLLNASRNENLWRQNSFELLDALRDAGLIDEQRHETLRGALAFYRLLLSRVRLSVARSTDVVELRAPYAEELAAQLGFTSIDDLHKELISTMKQVGAIYLDQMGSVQVTQSF